MNAAVVVVPPAAQTDAAGPAVAPKAPAHEPAPARPFESVLQGKASVRRTADQAPARPGESDRGKQATAPEKKATDAGPAEAQELVVPNGINLALTPAATGSGGTSDVAPGGAGADVAAMQAEIQDAQAQVLAAGGPAESAGEAGAQQHGLTGQKDALANENPNLTQTPDRGAALEAVMKASAAAAKDGAGQMAAAEGGRGKLDATDREAMSREAAKPTASEMPKGKDAEQVAAAVRSQAVPPEKATEVRPGQSSVQTGTERSESPAAVAPDKVAVMSDGAPAREAPEAGASPEPQVSRQQLADQVVRAARLNLARGASRFEMRLEPPSLGRLGVVMDLKDGALNISFKVESQAVKEALQSSLPQLREALASQGLNVEGFDVQGSWRGARQQDDSRPEPGLGQWSGGSRAQEADGISAGVQAVRAGSGLLDCWA